MFDNSAEGTLISWCIFSQMTKSVTCPEELGGLASQVTVDYGQLAHQGYLAAATAEPEEVRTLFFLFSFLWRMWGERYTPVWEKKSLFIASFSNCAAEMSDWVISIGLHFTPKCFRMYLLTHWSEQMFGVLWYDASSSRLHQQCEIKQKCNPPASVSRSTHGLLTWSFSLLSRGQQCVEILY